MPTTQPVSLARPDLARHASKLLALGSLALAFGAGALAQSPCCLDFDDGTTGGFAPCTTHPNVWLAAATPGPSGSAFDYYLRLTDGSGASAVCAPVPCPGDWSHVGECPALCFDYRLFEDGSPGGTTPVTPKIVITSGSLRAAFSASFTVVENDPWVTICAPLGPLVSGLLPSNANGSWQMLDSAPNSAWTTLISNVTGYMIGTDLTSSPSEVIGYDNICFEPDVCDYSGVNKDLVNDTGATVTGVDLVLDGIWTLDDFRGFYLSDFPGIELFYPGNGTTILRWSGGSVAPGGMPHIGYAIWAPSTDVLGVFWTVGGVAIGCAPQCNVRRDPFFGGQVEFVNSATDCQPQTLYTGDLAIEYYEVVPHLSDWNGVTQRNPIHVDFVSSSLCMLPGGSALVNVPSPPAEALFALLVFEVGTNAALSGAVTADWLLVPLGDDGTLGTSYCQAEANSTGLAGSISAAGTNVAAINDLTLTASDLPQNQFGYFLNSQTQGLVVGPGGSQGNLCLGGAIGRYDGSVFNSGLTGSASQALDLQTTPTPFGPVAILAGQTWNWQAWYRDLNPGPTSNFTDAISITFQ